MYNKNSNPSSTLYQFTNFIILPYIQGEPAGIRLVIIQVIARLEHRLVYLPFLIFLWRVIIIIVLFHYGRETICLIVQLLGLFGINDRVSLTRGDRRGSPLFVGAFIGNY
jgi:hypothetical protein